MSIRRPAGAHREQPGWSPVSCENRPMFVSLPLSPLFPGWRETREWETERWDPDQETSRLLVRAVSRQALARLGIGAPGVLPGSWEVWGLFSMEGEAGGWPWPCLRGGLSGSLGRWSPDPTSESGQEMRVEGCRQGPLMCPPLGHRHPSRCHTLKRCGKSLCAPSQGQRPGLNKAAKGSRLRCFRVPPDIRDHGLQ